VYPSPRTPAHDLADSRLTRLTSCDKALIVLFILSLPLCNPWVRGDGVGYYAFARSLLIEHRLDFRRDWLQANASFQLGRVDERGEIRPEEYTLTGHLNNHFAVGPALLWLPPLVLAHAGVLIYDRLGGHVAADGFSRPYLLAMSLATACYGFAGLFLAFRMARKYVDERWAFLATVGVWLASSLAVYMYLNPAWSHALSAFSVAIFLCYWQRTRGERTFAQWVALGALGGLMMDVYYLNVALFIFPLIDLIRMARPERPQGADRRQSSLLHFLISAGALGIAALVAFLPTLITKKIIYGSFFNFGYIESWFWYSPAFLKIFFSSEHGLFSWTPLLILAVAGFFALRGYDRDFALRAVLSFAVFAYMLGCYQDWHGISSFGSRFFVSMTPLFVIGLAASFAWLARRLQQRRTLASQTLVLTGSLVAIFALWNVGLIFQWGTHLIPARGPISWRTAAYNQFAVVPGEAGNVIKAYLSGRSALMNRIEQQDVQQLKSQPANGDQQ
jgi:hypothetical protein